MATTECTMTRAAPPGTPSLLQDLNQTWRLDDDTLLHIRLSRPDDALAIQEFVRQLSPDSRYQRFFHALRELPPAMLDRFVSNDRQRAMTILAVRCDNEPSQIVGMVQYMAQDTDTTCDFAVVVADQVRRGGVATKLAQVLLAQATEAGFTRMECEVLAQNQSIQHCLTKLGFSFGKHPEGEHLRKASTTLPVSIPGYMPMQPPVSERMPALSSRRRQVSHYASISFAAARVDRPQQRVRDDSPALART